MNERNESIEKQCSLKSATELCIAAREYDYSKVLKVAEHFSKWIASGTIVIEEEVKDDPKKPAEKKGFNDCDNKDCSTSLSQKDVEYSEKYAQKFKGKSFCYNCQKKIWNGELKPGE